MQTICNDNDKCLRLNVIIIVIITIIIIKITLHIELGKETLSHINQNGFRTMIPSKL